jgi:hypothetical protein
MRSKLHDNGFDWKYSYGYSELDRDARDRHGKVVANYRDPGGGLVFNLHHVVRTGDWWAVRLFAYRHMNGHGHGPQRHDRSRQLAQLLFGPAIEERPDPRWYGPRLLYHGDPRQHQRYGVVTRRCIPPIWPLDVTLPAELMALVPESEQEQPRRMVSKALSPRAEAKRAGAKRFFGKICPKHPKLKGERCTSNAICISCLRVANSKRLEADIRCQLQLLKGPAE